MFPAFVVISIILATAPEAALGGPRQHRQPRPPAPGQATPPPNRPSVTAKPALPCTLEHHPYVVSLMDWPSTKFFCFGTMIAELWLLTAAHCFYRPIVGETGCHNYSTTPLPLTEVHLSTGFRMYVSPGVAKRPADAEQAEVKLVSDIYIVPGYYVNQHHITTNDLALIKLQQPLKKSKFIGYAKLPQAVINEGYLYPTGGNPKPNILAVWVPRDEQYNKVACRHDIVIDPPDVCKKTFYNQRETVTYSDIICVVFPKDKMPDRLLHNGAPLIDYNTVVGVGAHGYGGDGYKFYYTRVDRLLDSINKIMSKESSGSSRYVNILLLLIPSVCLYHTIYNK